MEHIDVADQWGKNYWNTAKDAVYGKNAWIQGVKYNALQDLLNTKIRSAEILGQTQHPYLQWSDRTPRYFKKLNLYDTRSYDKGAQPYLELTCDGKVYLQRILNKHYGLFQRAPSIRIKSSQ